jgi:hypothetical protein
MTQPNSILLSHLLLIVMTATSCHLDASNKRACDNSGDCLNGHVCVNHACEILSPGSTQTSTPPDEFSEPTNVTAVFQQATTCFQVRWEDRSTGETAFEIQRSSQGLVTNPSEYFYLAQAAADVTKVEVCFPRVETFLLRVCALRADEPPSCSTAVSVDVGLEQVSTVRPAQAPSKPAVSSSSDGAVTTLSWSIEGIDFKDSDPNRCGFRIYQCDISGFCEDMPRAWTIVTGLAANEDSWILEGDLATSSLCDFAVAAYNRYGESQYWVASKLPCLR